MFSRKYKIIFILLVVIAAMQASMAAAEPSCPLDSLVPVKVGSLEKFKQIPVLNQGRIKPVDTYARTLLLQLSGRQSYGKEKAVEWVARFMFAPRTTFNDKIFLINNPEILEALKIEPDQRRRYSYKQLEPGYEKIRALAEAASNIDDKNQSLVEKEILRVYSNLELFIRLSGAFAYAFPHPDFTIQSPQLHKELQLTEGKNQFSFYDIMVKTDQVGKLTESLEGKPKEQWSEVDHGATQLMNALYFWTEHYSACPLGLIPTKTFDDEDWLSPMDTIISAFNDPVLGDEIKNLRDMTIYYWNGQQLEFDLAVKAFIFSTTKRLSPNESKAVQKIPIEIIYNKLNLLSWAKLFYVLALIFFGVSLGRNEKWVYCLLWGTVIAAVGPHLIALVLRVVIMSRPPVSNLYETFVFVGLIASVLGIILEVINKNRLGLGVSAICGFLFLIIASKFSSDGDTMQMLVAVLNSNFWLSTHVLSITIGYAGCCVAGIVGHIYVIQAIARPQDKARLESIYKNLLGLIGFGLTMTFLGTALGGIWADQSWGRFWGWDPKENGALLIILWCAILLHSRIGKIIHPLGVAVGSILGLIVVIWAWFGVNLLSVGLHSYGFTSGVAYNLAAYIFVEFLFIAVTVILLGNRGVKI